MLPETVFNIHGFLSQPEGELLYRLASEVPPGGVIVEIGSFQGRSTVCLGLGAKAKGAQVWAIDPHDDCQVNDETHYGMENHVALLRNLLEYDVADTVRVVAVSSQDAAMFWGEDAKLVFIDGNHNYAHIKHDLIEWSGWCAGKLAVHDSSGHFSDVSRALDEFLEFGFWKIVERVDATTVLERA